MTLDTAAIRSAARAAHEGPWVAPINSPLDIVLPATYRDRLPVTVVSAASRTEAQFITALDPVTTLALLERKVPLPAIELLREFALTAARGDRATGHIGGGSWEVTINGTSVATTDSADIATFLTLMTVDTALALLDYASEGA